MPTLDISGFPLGKKRWHTIDPILESTIGQIQIGAHFPYRIAFGKPLFTFAIFFYATIGVTQHKLLPRSFQVV